MLVQNGTKCPVQAWPRRALPRQQNDEGWAHGANQSNELQDLNPANTRKGENSVFEDEVAKVTPRVPLS